MTNPRPPVRVTTEGMRQQAWQDYQKYRDMADAAYDDELRATYALLAQAAATVVATPPR